MGQPSCSLEISIISFGIGDYQQISDDNRGKEGVESFSEGDAAPVWLRFLPESPDRVLDNKRVRGEDGERMLNGLADKHPVKRVFVDARQFAKMQGVLFS